MKTHDELRTLIEDMQAGSKDWERESAARLEALNRQCDKLLAVIDAAQAGVKALNVKCDPPAPLKIDDRGIVAGMADDGWISFCAAGLPPGDHQLVTVMRRDGETERAPACAFRWCHDGAPWDIVAYKVEG